MKAMSTAQTIPCSSGIQKPRANSPRTPRHSGLVASSGVATAASLRIARQMCPTVAAKVRLGLWATLRRNSPERLATSRKKALIG